LFTTVLTIRRGSVRVRETRRRRYAFAGVFVARLKDRLKHYPVPSRKRIES
jgi:hypothetical protein